MTRSTRLLLSAAALFGLLAGTDAASAQGYYGDGGPPPFRRGPGWDRPPPRGPWDHWHRHRHWRDGGFEGRGGWRDGGRGPRGGFGDDGGRREFRPDDGGRGPGGGPRFRPGDED